MALSQTLISYIDVRFFAHATENSDKVFEAVHHLFPPDYVDDIVFKKNNLKGHYGNPITLFETRIKKKEIIEGIVKVLSSGLSKLDKEMLLREIDLHVKKGSLYIRLEKQAAFQGEFKLCSADPIRVHIRFKKSKLEDKIKTCKELGILL
jgi:RNA binding exosome subunit